MQAWNSYRDTWQIPRLGAGDVIPPSAERRDEEFLDAAVSGRKAQQQPALWDAM